jgi:hypothetical protein
MQTMPQPQREAPYGLTHRACPAGVARIEWVNVSGQRLRLQPPRGLPFELAPGDRMQITSEDAVGMWWVTAYFDIQVAAGLLSRREVDPV